MQARPRFITTLLALSAATIVAGCGDTSTTEDPLAAVAEQYRRTLRDRPVVREQPGATDDTAESLRQLAGRAQSAGRDGNEQAAAILAAGIRSTAATLEYDEAMRAESQAAALRDLVRSLAADADRLAAAADDADGLDIGDTTIVLETQLARAREAFNAADAELEELRNQTELAASERDELLAVALEYDETANESAQEAADRDPIAAQDYVIDASYFRGEAHKARIAAALSEISIQTLAPTMTLADARREGQSQVIDAAREARRAAENRVDEARSFAAEVRDLVDELATAAAERLARVEALENSEILPRLEASIADFEAAASAARPLTRGGSREDAAAGWRSIANAQFGAGRAQWEIATVQGRRADLFARLAAGGVLTDAASASQAAEAAFEARKTSLEAAEAAFTEALSTLGNIQGDDAGASLTRATIERAISGVKGEAMAKPPTPAGGGTPSFAGGGGSTVSSGGGGFSSPSEAANFLSDDSMAFSPAAFNRLKSSLRATTPGGKAVENLLMSAGLTVPLVEALSAQFGEQAVMAAFAEDDLLAGGGPMASMETTFTVASSEGDTATLKSSDGSQSLTLVKTPEGWVIDLDATVESDPNVKMMVQMMGPMMEQMLAPLRTAVEDLAARVEAGEFDSLDAAMAAIEESMSAAQPQGLPGGF